MYQEVIVSSCGVSVLCEFDSAYGIERKDLKTNIPPGGCGYHFALFVVDDAVCDKWYKALCKQYTLLYQSPPRKNRNSGNICYLCIFASNEDEKYGWDDQDRVDE